MILIKLRSKQTIVMCGLLLVLQQGSFAAEQQNPTIPPEQLQSLVAPVALYPDELLGQLLVASTYPLEIVQLEQWMRKNSNLKGQALISAVKEQKWDPSVQALVTFPDVVKQLTENIQWTADLGNAFLAQQGDVMNAIQSMRAKAKNAGKLESGPQQKVETEVVENRTVVVIESADSQVVYVPSYDPAVIWGAAVYPYPPVTYPPASYIATGLISFGAGIAIGAAWGGGWGWGCGWGHNDIEINNNFIRNNNLNVSNIDRNRASSTWRHDARHRGGAPYPNREIANRYGGSARGESRVARRGEADLGGRQLARGDFDRSPGSANRMGNRQIPRSSFENRGAFGGSRSSGLQARASSARGHSSMGGRRGGFGGRRR